jgi:uncharacterized membrane protein
MPTPLLILTLVCALGCGTVAGVVFAFSNFVMPALGRLPAGGAIAAMQQINIKAINPLFMSVLLGTAVTCVATIVAAVADPGSYSPYLIGAGMLYLVGTIGVTRAFNIPRNDALARLDPSTSDAPGQWGRYLAEWSTFNHVRTVTALLAAGLEIGAIHVA